jgi:hypothetical protein
MPDPHLLRLDRSRYHSSVHGEFQSPTHYWQDGLPFDAVGHLVVAECDAEMLAKADAKAPRPQPRATPDEGTPAPDNDPPPGEVNLELWAKGEARYPPFKVFAAIRERYSKSVSTFADAIEFLVNEAKLIPARGVEETARRGRSRGGAGRGVIPKTSW